MAYKRYIYKNGKKFGPYYYESFRNEEGKIEKKYVGTTDPNKKKKNSFSLKNRHLVMYFLGIFILVGIFLFTVNFLGSPGRVDLFEGKVNLFPQEFFPNLIGFTVNGEIIETVNEKYDTDFIDLEITSASSIKGYFIKNLNKNKIMHFDVSGKNIDLYFELVNYTELLETLEIVENISEENISLDVVEKEIKESKKLIAKEVRGRGVSQKPESVGKPNQTGKPNETRKPDDVGKPNETRKPDDVGKPNETGKPLFVLTGEVLKDHEKKENLSMNKIIKNVSSKKVDIISEYSSTEIENFDIQIDKSKDREYKWTYKLKLTDLNFLAKIDVVVGEDIIIYNEDTLRIGDSLLSFNDLTNEGYNISFGKVSVENFTETRGKPSLEFKNIISVYIEKDFTNNSEGIKLGDILILDPTLIIIEIIDAEHLNENKTLIENIYESVKAIDGNWTEPIQNNEYVRVYFEKPLNYENDITLYARSLNGSSQIEVYEVGGTEVIAKFENISEEGTYKVLLTNMSEEFHYTQETFDLKIISESGIEFDYIVDPKAYNASDVIYQCGDIDEPGTYVMNQSLSISSATCLTINVSNVTLDCAGFNIDGNDAASTYGVDIYSGTDSVYLDNITVKNCNMSDFDSGIYLRYINNSNFENISTFDNMDRGIYLFNSNYNNFSNFSSNSETMGISMQDSSNNKFVDINIRFSHTLGIYIFSSSEYNTFDNFSIQDVSGTGDRGIDIRSNNNNFTNGTLSNNYYGINLGTDSDLNIFTGINITNNSEAGIYFGDNAAQENLFYNNFFNNTINVNPFAGADNFYNTTLNCTGENNIMGGDCIGGNFWMYPNMTGFSINCLDEDENGICDSSNDLGEGEIDYLSLTSLPPTFNILYPLNYSISSYTFYPQSINYTASADAESCWYNVGLANSTSVSCGTNLTINEHSSPSWGNITWTLYGNNSYGRINQEEITFFKNNTIPTVSGVNITTSPPYSNTSLTCEFSVIDPDYLVKIGTGGTESEIIRPYTGDMYGIYCDDTYCYGAHNAGYFTKTFKNGTIAIGTGGTGSGVVMSSIYPMYGIYCDDTYCYGAHMNGYFTKTFKNGTIAIGTGGTESEVIQPYTSYMNSIDCDDTYCYGGHSGGYFTKTFKNGTIILGIGGTEGVAINPNINVMYGIYCDDTYCYGGHASGYFTKTFKNGTIAIGTEGTEGSVVRSFTQNFRNIYCDDTYCYGAHNAGYFTKTFKNGTIAIGTGGTEGEAVSSHSRNMVKIYCDDTYCYGAHDTGYFTKIFKNGTIVLGDGGTEGPAIRPYTNNIYGLDCDDTYCYAGHSDGYFTKIEKDSGDLLSTNISWYKDGVNNLSYILSGIVNNITTSTILDLGNTTKDENWTCEATPYDFNVYGIQSNDSEIVINTPPVIDWFRINAPLYDSAIPSTDLSYSDHDGDLGTSYFQWYVNDVNVENDTVSSITNGISIRTYLNESLNEGDKVNLTVFVGDGTDNSSVNYLSQVIFGMGGDSAMRPIINGQNTLDCDDTYCYIGHDLGYFTKVFKNGTIAIGSGGTEGPAINPNNNLIYDIFCDDIYCYGGHYNGYFTKTFKNGTIAIGTGGTEGVDVRVYIYSMYGIDCDDTYCYGAHDGGYFTKVLKNGTIVIGTGGTESEEMRPSTYDIYDIDCDDTYCYGGHDYGYFTKMFKNGTIVIGTGGTESEAIRLNTYDMNSIDCDDTYCYGGHDYGYFTKMFKNGTIVIGTGGTESEAIRPNTLNMNSINCDDTYCYMGHSQGYFTKVFKNGTIAIGTGGTESSAIQLNINAISGIDCDDTYCYGAHDSGYFTKILKDSEIIVQSAPKIESLDNPANFTFHNFNIIFGFTPNGTSTHCDLWGDWNEAWHLNQTLNNPNDLINNNFTTMNITPDGEYLWNVQCHVNDISGYFNTENYTMLIDATPPEITRYDEGMPENNSVGGATIGYNWTVTDNWDTNITCYTMQGNTILNTYYLANDSSLNITESSLVGGQYPLYLNCVDNVDNFKNSSKLTYLVAVINMTSPSSDGIIYRQGDITNFRVNEIEGKDYLTNSTILILNSTGTFTKFYNSINGDNHSENYTWDGKPDYITIKAFAFNTSVGEIYNGTDSVTGVFLRGAGNTSVPLLSNACPNETYVINGSTIKIGLRANLDTLILRENVTVIYPDGNPMKLIPISGEIINNSIIDDEDFGVWINYSVEINQTGNYTILANVTDYENQSASWNYIFYSAAEFNTYKINSSTITDINRIRKCVKDTLDSGTELTMTIPDNALIDLNVTKADLSHNISLEIKDINLTSNITDAVTYRELSNETEAPETMRKVSLFEINSSLNFTDYKFIYDYSTIAHTINDESSLLLYKCESLGNCVLVDTNAIINTDENIMTATLTSFSVFMVAESGTTTVTETVTSSSGGGSTETVYRSLNIITPGDVELGLTDQIVIPITLENPEDISLNNIKLSAVSTTTDIDPVFEKEEIDNLGAGENETIMLFLESHSTPGEYEIHLGAEVSNPEFVETAIVYVRLVEVVGKEKVIERVILAQDLFRENPQCLELNDLLIYAQKLLDEGNVDEATKIVQETIYKCKELVTSDNQNFLISPVKEWKGPVLIASILIILVLFIVIMLRKPKFNLYTSKKEKSRRKRKRK